MALECVPDAQDVSPIASRLALPQESSDRFTIGSRSIRLVSNRFTMHLRWNR